MKLKKWLKKSEYAHVWVDEDLKDGALYRWEHKKVYLRKRIWNNNNLDDVSLKGVGDLSFDQQLHTLKLVENDDVENLKVRPNCTLVFNLHNLDATKYNRVSLMMYIKATGFVNFYVHFGFGNSSDRVTHAPSIIPNKWNKVLFEVPDIQKDNVETLTITPFLFGTPPEATPELEIYVKDIFVEKVDEDYIKGWDTQERIAYSHVGYFINAKKEAITQGHKESNFYLKNKQNQIVYTGKVTIYKNDETEYNVMNFSDFTTSGEYYLSIGDNKTNLFEISQNPYLSSIWKSLQFLRTLRCGEEVEKVHSACHLNCRSVHSDGRSVPVFGGWHDAGDVSQFEICTAEMAEAILDLATEVKSQDKQLYKRLLEEAKVGITWLLRTSFEDGNRALAVGYRIWRKNILHPDNTAVNANVSENGPFENFLAASALLKAYLTYKEYDKIYAEWCMRIALIDYQAGKEGYELGIHTKRWGSNVDSQVAGAAAHVVSLLYEITSDDSYINDASYYGRIILSCQQQEIPAWDIPIRGFFYEDPKHEKMLTYEHRGHEQNPIQGLVSLCHTFINHPDYESWVNGIKLYSEYIKTTYKYTYPYGLVPAHVYDLDKFNMERFTVPSGYGTIPEALLNLKEQARHGIKLNQNVYLRKLPVAIQRRGYHATLLSKTKAISLCADFLDDDELMQISIDQLEWVMGKNPFSSSSMYGEGYNYHPLYVAYSPELIGALPVGFETKGYDDKPYWPVVNNAVFKEIWGHTTGKYLFVLADILKNKK